MARLLHDKMAELPDGSHMQGLQAVLLHISTAILRLNTGRKNEDVSYFTDTIYRSNQAFEGSLKEAYRVLAKQDPENQRPYEIEQYFQQKNLLRPRILSLFTNYRKDWRNPSTHDYRLDFDEGEALLAISTVATFAYLLMDQMASSLIRQRAEQSPVAVEKVQKNVPAGAILDEVAKAIDLFCRDDEFLSRARDIKLKDFPDFLAGMLSVSLPEFQFLTNETIGGEKSLRPDIVVMSENYELIVEVKYGVKGPSETRNRGLVQLRAYLEGGKVPRGILFIYGGIKKSLNIERLQYDGGNVEILIVTT